RQPKEERDAVTDIANAYVPTSSGRAIPLTQIAKIGYAWEPGVVWRENRDFAITVQADVAEGVQGPTVSSELWPKMRELQARMP
ncbi:efflux RND transporter permease subunit, partial [Escherichia coli]